MVAHAVTLSARIFWSSGRLCSCSGTLPRDSLFRAGRIFVIFGLMASRLTRLQCAGTDRVLFAFQSSRTRPIRQRHFSVNVAFEIGEHHDFNPPVQGLVRALYRHLGVDPDPPQEFDGYLREAREGEPYFGLIEISVSPGEEF